jgi:hypothetical protein
MVRGLAWCLLAVGLMGCEAGLVGPTVAVSPQYDRMWAEQRRLCLAAPQGDHCDVYLRNETPPAPYATDGILIQQRRLCFENPSVANCSLAQRMGQEAAAAAAARGAPFAARQARPPEADDEDEPYGSASVNTTDALPYVATEPLPAPTSRRATRRTSAAAVSPQCSPAALASLDLVEPPARAAILRRCGASAR